MKLLISTAEPHSFTTHQDDYVRFQDMRGDLRWLNGKVGKVHLCYYKVKSRRVLNALSSSLSDLVNDFAAADMTYLFTKILQENSIFEICAFLDTQMQGDQEMVFYYYAFLFLKMDRNYSFSNSYQ